MTRLEIGRKVMTELSRDELENLCLVKMIESGAVSNFATPIAILVQPEVFRLVGEKSYERAVNIADWIVKRQLEIDAQQSQTIRNN